MLREVVKKFDIDGNIEVKPGDIIDVSNWKNRGVLEKQNYIAPTDATKPTVDLSKPVAKKSVKSKPESSAPKQSAKARRSALASRPRVFR